MMPTTVMILVAVLSLSCGMVGMVLLIGPNRARQVAVTNLQRGLLRTDPESDAATEGNAGRGRLTVLVLRLTPRGTVARIDRLLGRAGRPASWPVERVLVVKPVLAAISAAFSLMIINSSQRPMIIVMMLAATVVSYFVPDLLLHSRGVERSRAITLELADTLDQMTIAVEAGLGFDAAMSRAGKNGKGPLAEELVRTLQDIQMGRSRRQAYDALAGRTDSPDLRRFIRAIIQADAYGISVADVLRTQAKEMRLKRRQRAEEKAMQIPVKVIFPLMLCILPVLFIVLLGPVVISVMAAFG